MADDYKILDFKVLESMDCERLKEKYVEGRKALYGGDVSTDELVDEKNLLIAFILETQAMLPMKKSLGKRETLETHATDCTITMSLDDNNPEYGMCICGYGLRLSRIEDHSQIYSPEMKKRIKSLDKIGDIK